MDIRRWVQEQFEDCDSNYKEWEEQDECDEDDDEECEGDITYYIEGTVKFHSYNFEYEFFKINDGEWQCQYSEIEIADENEYGEEVDEEVKKFIEQNYNEIVKHSLEWLPCDL